MILHIQWLLALFSLFKCCNCFNFQHVGKILNIKRQQNLGATTTTTTIERNTDSKTVTSSSDDDFFDADVGIIGAGPAGLALSHALLNRGYKVKVFERRTSFRPVGAAVFMYPLALNALREVSPILEEKLRSVSTPIRKISLTSIVDETLDVGTDRLDEATEVFGSPFVSVKFWDMLCALREGLPDEIFHFGHEMVEFQHMPDDDGDHDNKGGVLLQFRQTKDGSNDDDEEQSITTKAKVKVLIDAAGIRSKTRQQLVGDKPIPRLRATFAVAPKDGIKKTIGIGANGDRQLSFLVGDGVAVTTASLANGDVWWTQTRYDDDPTAPIPTGNEQSLRDRLKERFEPWPQEIKGLVEATDSKDVIECTIAELPVSFRWGERDVTLLGDSAHAQLPALGLGISTAFSDVSELCKQIDKFGLNRKALRWYEAVRVPQTAFLQLASRMAYFANIYLGNK